jgi:hypothetical protein
MTCGLPTREKPSSGSITVAPAGVLSPSTKSKPLTTTPAWRSELRWVRIAVQVKHQRARPARRWGRRAAALRRPSLAGVGDKVRLLQARSHGLSRPPCRRSPAPREGYLPANELSKWTASRVSQQSRSRPRCAGTVLRGPPGLRPVRSPRWRGRTLPRRRGRWRPSRSPIRARPVRRTGGRTRSRPPPAPRRR